MNFLNKENKVADGEDNGGDKKIEFSKKLSDSDEKDLFKKDPLKKGGFLNFFKKKEEKSVLAPVGAVPSDKEKRGEETVSSKISLNQKASGPAFSSVSAPVGRIKPNGKNSAKKKYKNPSFLKKDGKGRGEGDSDILEVNLVRGEIVKFFDWQKNILILLLCVFVSLVIISGIYWGISWWGVQTKYDGEDIQSKSFYELNKQIKELNDEVEEVLRFKEKLAAVDFLLDRHIYWTNFFNFLEENTLANVYFSGFSGNNAGEYNLSVQSDDFNAIEAQVEKFLSHKQVKTARVSAGTISKNEEGVANVSFSLSLSLNGDIFFK